MAKDDVIEIDGASNNSVNDVRSIKENISYQPVKSKYKVYIIDEVHMLSTSAFNALLKTLEEPSGKTIFLLTTSQIDYVLMTIQSRVRHYHFSTIDDTKEYPCMDRKGLGDEYA